MTRTFLDEEAISRSEKPSKKYVSKKFAKEYCVKPDPFIKGLKEAEEEPSDDEDENIEVVHLKVQGNPELELGDVTSWWWQWYWYHLVDVP